jgi:hypothetical protein
MREHEIKHEMEHEMEHEQDRLMSQANAIKRVNRPDTPSMEPGCV